MPSSVPRPEGSNGKGSKSLTERIQARVHAAGRAQDRRDGASRPRVGRRSAAAKAAQPIDGGAGSEVTALKSVFRHMGKLHRQYRVRTGESTSPGLRAAAMAFKEQPTLVGLVVVAGFLEELELLQD